METAVRRFARRILAIHLALFLGVLALVVYASREIYNAALLESNHQAETRQALLADQTAEGVENFYDSIFSDLRLLRQADAGADRDALSRFLPRRSSQAAALIAEQVKGRVSRVFIVDRANPNNIRPLESGAANSAEWDSARQYAAKVMTAYADWLPQVSAAAISPFQIIDGEGVNLVAVPMGAERRRFLVAVVPLERVEKAFLGKLNQRRALGAFLVDDSSTILIASRPRLVGQNVSRLADENIAAAMVEWQRQGYRGSKFLPKPMEIGTERFDPSMVTAHPVKISDRTWHLFVLSPLGEAEAAVTRLFEQTVQWGVFVAIVLSLILVSSGVQLIRARDRLERVRSEMLTRELDQARQIQLAWLPSARINRADVDLAAVNHPAQHISGDFYNWFDLPDGRVAVVIGDVTGHGMAAAFLMATAQLLVRNTLPRFTDPGECLAEVNRQLCVQMFTGQFVTMQILVIDPDAGRLELATAGHPPPLLCEADEGRFRAMPVESQLPLGVRRDLAFPTERYELSPRASLLLYTDGVPEAQSPDGALLTLDGLIDRLDDSFASAEALVGRVVSTVNAFRGERDLDDDLTIVAVQLAGRPSPRVMQAQPV